MIVGAMLLVWVNLWDTPTMIYFPTYADCETARQGMDVSSGISSHRYARCIDRVIVPVLPKGAAS